MSMKAQMSANKRILWVSGTYYPDIGGAEWSMQANACLLKRHFGQIILTWTQYGNRVFDGIPIIELTGGLNDFNKIIEWYQPHFIAIQGTQSKKIFDVMSRYKINTVYFIRALTNLDFEYYLANLNLRIVANSEWIADWFFKTWKTKTIILHPVVIPWVSVANNKNPNMVTHVGDAKVKGGERIYKIAKSLQDEKFLITKSWPAFRKDGKWDRNKIKLLEETDGAVTAFETDFENFSLLSNVRYTMPFLDPKALYSQSKIILVASTWKEPFGRVILEAILNSIPVVVSPEAYDKRWHGLVYKIENGDDIEEWCKLIKKIINYGSELEIDRNMELFRSNYNTLNAENTLLTQIFS